MRKRLVLIFFLVPLWVYLRGVYRDRLGAFGCFDDCFNIAGGYFITLGKRLYADFFFNHQPIPAYISWAIQTIYQPQSIYELILRHRMVLIYYFAAANVFLTLRFGLAGFAFAMLYETTKGYVFGERFLAESMIVYPLVYVFGLILQRKQFRLEPVLAAIATWFVVFSREPYVPIALFLFGVSLSRAQRRVMPIAVFAALSAFTIFVHNPADYWWNVVVASARSVAGAEIQSSNVAGMGFFSIFFYPIQVFFGGTWNHFRWIEVVLSALLLVLLVSRRQPWRVVIIALGLANIRQVTPGTVYYGAFHHTVWYALLIATVALLLRRFWIGWIAFGAIVVYAVFSPQSYLHERVDRAAEFQIGYSHYSTQGEIIRRLSQATHTMFVQEWDELIYWQAKRPSAYRYVWWSSTLADVPTYRDAKAAMWQEIPPDFYVGLCNREDPANTSLPPSLVDQYLRLTQNGKPSCIFVRTTVARAITLTQWQSVLDFSVDTPAMIYTK